MFYNHLIFSMVTLSLHIVLKYCVSYGEVERVVGYDTPMFPIPYKRYKIEYNDGSEKTIGYKVLGLIFITDEI